MFSLPLYDLFSGNGGFSFSFTTECYTQLRRLKVVCMVHHNSLISFSNCCCAKNSSCIGLLRCWYGGRGSWFSWCDIYFYRFAYRFGWYNARLFSAWFDFTSAGSIGLRSQPQPWTSPKLSLRTTRVVPHTHFHTKCCPFGFGSLRLIQPCCWIRLATNTCLCHE